MVDGVMMLAVAGAIEATIKASGKHGASLQAIADALAAPGLDVRPEEARKIMNALVRRERVHVLDGHYWLPASAT